ncbi:hypothetical protein [Peribacillus frigoritolerans]|uniref:hypothetical protein n=1 Tax=Peribacillus frigoritolerans TaxID=450367 RepID=UPI002161B9E8|nr:hypothetical protein [Peribacillus frigoritolerans]
MNFGLLLVSFGHLLVNLKILLVSFELLLVNLKILLVNLCGLVNSQLLRVNFFHFFWAKQAIRDAFICFSLIFPFG